VVVIPPGGGKAPSGVTRGCPGGAEQRQRRCGQGAVPRCGALAAVDRALAARAIEGRHLQGEGCREPESQAIDGSAVALVVQGCGGREESPDLCNPEHGGETVGRVRAHERAGVPVALADVRREAADATGAHAQGRWGEAVNVCAVQEGGLELLCGEPVGRCALELSQQTDRTDVGFLRPCALATALKRGNHVWTQGGHEISPFVRGRVVRLRRKTS
jgi:hypothetical protein